MNPSIPASEKRIVIPGEVISEERKRTGAHVFVDNGRIVSETLGVVYADAALAQVVALRGKYEPILDDIVIGIVAQETFNGYLIDTGSMYNSFISKEAVRDKLERGSVVSAKVVSVSEIGEVELEEPRGFFGGELIRIAPVKVPRVIGKQGSMLNVLKNGTNCNIVVGRNGRLWIKGGNTSLLRRALDFIEAHSHESNLTQRIEEFLAHPPAQQNANG